MFRLVAGVGLLFCFGLGIFGSSCLGNSPKEIRMDIALCTLILGIPGAVMLHSGQESLKTKNIILEMSLDMLESEDYIDINKLSILTEKPQNEIIKHLENARIEYLVKTKIDAI